MVLWSFFSFSYTFFSFPPSYFGFLLDLQGWLEIIPIMIAVAQLRCYMLPDNRRRRSAVKRSKECTLDKEVAGDTSIVSELNGLRKNNSDVL